MAKNGFFSREGQGGGFGGFIPERGTERHVNMIENMAQGGQLAALQSGSPLLAFLAPMMGGAATARAGNLYDERQEAESGAAMKTLVGSMSPAAQKKADGLLAILNNPNVSDEYKSLAKVMLNSAMKPKTGNSSGGTWRPATPEEAATYGATTGQIAPNGRFYPSGSGTRGADYTNSALLRQKREASEMVNERLTDLTDFEGLDRDAAVSQMMNNPSYSWAMDLLGYGSNADLSAPSLSTPPVNPAGNPDPLGIR